ncbi:MAG: hypothetical protein AAGG01_04175, partial [Planctomycetota bacterium]
MNVTPTASVKLLVVVGFESRYQAWKSQVSPTITCAGPLGRGIEPDDDEQLHRRRRRDVQRGSSELG